MKEHKGCLPHLFYRFANRGKESKKTNINIKWEYIPETLDGAHGPFGKHYRLRTKQQEIQVYDNGAIGVTNFSEQEENNFLDLKTRYEAIKLAQILNNLN